MLRRYVYGLHSYINQTHTSLQITFVQEVGIRTRGETIYRYIDILQYLLLQYNTIWPIENIDILHIAIYCNILLDISRLKNKMINKCIKVRISACL